MRLKFLLVSLFLFSFACAQDKISPENYISAYKEIAIAEMQRVHIPASITLAQAMLESANGNSRLSKEGNNHFGIKCKKTWEGKVIYEDDDTLQECFRAYDSPAESFIDHSDYLTSGKRYASLFLLPQNDYTHWAIGLKEAGYATNPQYAQLLLSYIEKYHLYEFDDDTVSLANYPYNVKIRDSVYVNRTLATVVAEGETFESIAKEHKMLDRQLYHYNDLKKGAQPIPGMLLYLKPKRTKGNEEFHVITYGENMYYLSQKYGIKLKSLYRKNLLSLTCKDEPAVGSRIYLQHKRMDSLQLRHDSVLHFSKPPFMYYHPGFYSYTYLLQNKSENTTNSNKKEENKTEKSEQKEEDSFHIVQNGETLYSIGKKYALSIEELMHINHLQTTTLYSGQLLYLVRELKIDSNYFIEKKLRPISKDTLIIHLAQPGETVFSVARLYQISVDTLMKWNGLIGYALSLGQQLKIWIPVAVDSIDATQGGKYHIVKRGETLYSISRDYGISVEDLWKFNNLVDNTIYEGMRLRMIPE